MASILTISTQLAYAKMQGYLPAFTAAARQTGIDRNLLLAVASRESAMGITLNSLGLGDGGHGNGLMQIDDRSHGNFTSTHSPLNARANVLYGAQHLKGLIDFYGGNLRYALPAYNAGKGGVNRAVQQGLPPEYYTTGRDYASDVLQRYQILQRMSGASQNDDPGSVPSTNPRPEDKAATLLLITGGSLLASLGIAVYLAAKN